MGLAWDESHQNPYPYVSRGPMPLTRSLPWRQVGASGPRTSTKVTDPSPTYPLSWAGDGSGSTAARSRRRMRAMTETPETDPVGEHDPTGTDYARRIARSARATGPAPTRTTRSSAPPKMSGAGDDPRDPKRAGRVLDSYIADRGWGISVSIHT